jgi:hypothetical protein
LQFLLPGKCTRENGNADALAAADVTDQPSRLHTMSRREVWAFMQL